MGQIVKENAKYALAIIVLFVSFLSAKYLPLSEVLRGLIALPGVAALFQILYQLLRDDWQHSRNIDLQNRQQDFILATSSHAAKIAYEKHVLFCEEYIERIQNGRKEMLREGASPGIMNIGGDLVRIRQKHATWLTKEIEEKLIPFEKVLIKIGAQEDYLRNTAGQGVDEKKGKVIDEIYRSFGLVLGHEKSLNEEEENIHIDKIIDTIRDIVGVKSMVQLRTKSTDIALHRLEKL